MTVINILTSESDTELKKYITKAFVAYGNKLGREMMNDELSEARVYALGDIQDDFRNPRSVDKRELPTNQQIHQRICLQTVAGNSENKVKSGSSLISQDYEMAMNRWSYTRLRAYEECPAKVDFKYNHHIKEPPRVVPKGKTEHPMERGTRVHDGCERFVKGEGELPSEASQHFKAEFDHLRKLYIAKQVFVELDCGVDKSWNYIDEWNDDTWCLVKMDAEVISSDGTFGIIIDYKTGKRMFNEHKHGEQMQLYQLAFFKKHPELQRLRTELWYLDLGEVHSITYNTRKQGLRFQGSFNRRANVMLRDKKYKPTPSKFSCMWCPYGEGDNKTGHCLVGWKPGD